MAPSDWLMCSHAFWKLGDMTGSGATAHALWPETMKPTPGGGLFRQITPKVKFIIFLKRVKKQ